MNERVLKILVYAAGAACLYAFIAVRVPSLFNAVLKEKIMPEYWENTKYGELYYFSFIRNFREEGLPPHSEKYRFTEKHPAVHEADILLFGDSFFDFTRHTTFPEQLGDSLDMRAFYARMDRPLTYLEENGYEGTEEKILLFESAERYIPERFSVPHPVGPVTGARKGVKKAVADVRQVIFQDNTDVLYSTLLSRNYLTTGLYSLSTTFKFNTLGYITDLTPKYHLEAETPWLFYYDQLNGDPSSFYYRHSEEEIDTYCDNIAGLSANLKQHYNLKMVFMAIPSKYTINHTLINDHSYNQFLPRLYAGLEERGIPVVRIYEEYRDSEEVLYYGTDTHWNLRGQELAMEKTLDQLKPLMDKPLIANQ